MHRLFFPRSSSFMYESFLNCKTVVLTSTVHLSLAGARYSHRGTSSIVFKTFQIFKCLSIFRLRFWQIFKTFYQRVQELVDLLKKTPARIKIKNHRRRRQKLVVLTKLNFYLRKKELRIQNSIKQ